MNVCYSTEARKHVITVSGTIHSSVKWAFIQGVKMSKYLIPIFETLLHRPNFRAYFISWLGDMFLICLRDHAYCELRESDIHRLTKSKLIANSEKLSNFEGAIGLSQIVFFFHLIVQLTLNLEY